MDAIFPLLSDCDILCGSAEDVIYPESFKATAVTIFLHCCKQSL